MCIRDRYDRSRLAVDAETPESRRICPSQPNVTYACIDWIPKNNASPRARRDRITDRMLLRGPIAAPVMRRSRTVSTTHGTTATAEMTPHTPSAVRHPPGVDTRSGVTSPGTVAPVVRPTTYTIIRTDCRRG